MKDPNYFDVIVVGGGASGMMAAGRALELGKRVLLLEKNRSLGEKLKITGGGRCNITNAEFDIHKLLSKYGKAKDFLYSPFSQFGVQDTFDFFEKRGLPLVVQARKRAFPHTEKAIDVFRVLQKYIRHHQGLVRVNSPVDKINFSENKVRNVVVGSKKYMADNFIFATGGVSAPKTGSTGDGFKWLAKMEHTVKKSNPNIVPLLVKEKWVKDLSGVSLSFMKINFFLGGKRQFSKVGKILFTHFGLSGPLILNSAHLVNDLLEAGEVTARIDMYPDTDLGTLEKDITKKFDANKNKTLKNVFTEISPRGVAPALELLLGEELSEKKVHSVTREERKTILHLLKEMPVTIQGLMGLDRAVVSDGGIVLEEIDTKTMRSRKFKNLYITGDLLNIRRPSGGYSLQLCWTTGFVAGTHAST